MRGNVAKISQESSVIKRVYLANPYGFSQQQRSLLLPPIVQALEKLGVEVWEPFARNNQIDFSQTGWAYRVAQADLNDVKTCDGIFAIVNGTPPDEGVMVELGVAIALNKAIFLFRDDFRRCTDSEQYPLNLMVFAGLPETTWEDHYYTSIEEIGSSHKALYRWLQSG
jgi:nucleoside 2-deoxyribosyltransferase